MANYIICTCQRSGKTWLVRALEKINAGHAGEFVTMLHRGKSPFVDAWKRGGMAEFSRVVIDSQKDAKHAGICLHWNDFEALSRNIGMDPSATLTDLREKMGSNTKIILLSRRDVVAQAVSHYIMTVSGQAHNFQSLSGELADVPFDCCNQVEMSLGLQTRSVAFPI